jgi:hypothetical protein
MNAHATYDRDHARSHSQFPALLTFRRFHNTRRSIYSCQRLCSRTLRERISVLCRQPYRYTCFTCRMLDMLGVSRRFSRIMTWQQHEKLKHIEHSAIFDDR